MGQVGRFFTLVSGALVLVGCAPDDGYVASTPMPVAEQEPVVEPPVEVYADLEEPISSGPMDLPALSDITIIRSNLAEAPSKITVETAEIPEQPTRIRDQAAAERLFGNSGVTLQWISWEKRGRTWVAVDENGYWLLTGEQKGPSGERLDLQGFITEIGPDYFIYDGTIKVLGTPDAERFCNVTKRQWRFAVTQNRKYWRLREFEWCDGLTDYIDIYF